ncbi:CIC11C00000004581 [Sungouiella intermedia]|uniref:CIC11C00000000262 n=1 Tax=Sungouiella intermedia TaxID=45354 RepID=A0A1L0BAM4_9ASCO|nr:CIC11C00000004581 [[Candida] intermedia]SGZ50408.1 CIC11C00000000262 [[Candida] intermedia]
MYMIIFKHGVLTFHFSATPHPINVRRRARMLKDHLTVSTDWICYALIDDITDSFAPMIDSIEAEVYLIEDEIMKMHSVAWKRKGDMLRRIGECRKRVMSVMRLLGSKADVIKGFSKRFNENETISHDSPSHNTRLALRQEILMYLGDIQDHIVTMVQSLNHYEKLLARSHSNYLAQINIDMTKVNNDMNDVLGKITILGTIVLPINVVTGLWGMNCIVPGQDHEGLVWFYGILLGIFMFSFISYIYAKKVTGL